MRTRTMFIAAGLVAAVVALAAAGGAALASDDGTATGHTRTLHFLLRETQQVIDRAPAGPSNGDLVLLRGDLLNPRTRKVVGKEIGSYVMVDAANENRSIVQAVFTPNSTSALARADQIAVSGIFDSVPPKALQAITGGTGTYRGAHGQVVSTEGPDGLVDIVITVGS